MHADHSPFFFLYQPFSREKRREEKEGKEKGLTDPGFPFTQRKRE